MNKHDPYQPQRISLRYAIPLIYREQSISFAEIEATDRLAKQMCNYLVKDCMTKRLETDGVYESTVFELNGYFVTPQALDRFVHERMQKIQAGYPIVDFY